MDSIRNRYRSGFSLIEIVIVCVIIGIIAGVAVPIYYHTVVERGRGVEAREILFKSYGGFQRLLMDEDGFGGILTWNRLGMSDPHADARRFFDYNILPDTSNPDHIRAERRGDAAKWLEINLRSAAFTKSQPY